LYSPIITRYTGTTGSPCLSGGQIAEPVQGGFTVIQTPEFFFQGGNAMSDSDGGGSLTAYRPAPGRNTTAFPAHSPFH
jgi:hypothetical protein